MPPLADPSWAYITPIHHINNSQQRIFQYIHDAGGKTGHLLYLQEKR